MGEYTAKLRFDFAGLLQRQSLGLTVPPPDAALSFVDERVSGDRFDILRRKHRVGVDLFLEPAHRALSRSDLSEPRSSRYINSITVSE
jgi:hypothetical protein